MTDTLFCLRCCYFSKFISVINSYCGHPLNVVYIDSLSDEDKVRITQRSPTNALPLLKVEEALISGTIPIAKYLLSVHPEIFSKLYGKKPKKNAINDMWVNFILLNLLPIIDELIGQITGRKPTNYNIFGTAKSDLLKELDKINTHLTFKTFLVGHSVSFADLMFATVMHPIYILILTDDLKKHIPNVVRLFHFVANAQEVSRVLGRILPCKVMMKCVQVNPMQINSEKKKVEKQEKKDQNQKLPEERKEKEKETPDDDEEEFAGKKPKKIHPLEALPPSSFVLDDFKREFLNSKDKPSVLKAFWDKFDPNGYSLWFLHYNKTGDQGKLGFRTNNLKKNYLQKLDQFRKFTFSTYGVYGEEPNLEVEGVWMWRGTEIPEDIKENESYDYITFKKLDPSIESDRKIVEEFWLNVGEGNVVNGRPVFDVEYFK